MKTKTPHDIDATQPDPFYQAQVYLAMAHRLIMRGQAELERLSPHQKPLHAKADAEAEKVVGQKTELQELSHALIAARTLPLAYPDVSLDAGKQTFAPRLRDSA